MKIYFATTVVGDRSNIDHSKTIVRILEDKGHEVLTKHLILDDVFEKDEKLGADFVFQRDTNWLKQADAVIVDATGSSFGVGFETGFALGELKKKVFLLYNKNMEKKISKLARGLKHPNATVFGYSSEKELEDFVRKKF